MELNKIHNMDCLEGMKQLGDNSIDLIVTDPPYGIGIDKMNFVTSGAVKVGGAYRNDYTNHNTGWDNKKLDKNYFDEIIRISKNQIIFGAEHLCDNLPLSRGWIVWDKRTEDKYSNDFADCELAWTSYDKPTKIYRYLWSGMLQSEMGLYKEKRYHPTQKPIRLIKWLIEKYYPDCNIVLDAFMGSGTTAVACKQLNKDFIGFEINKDYCNVAEERLKQGVLMAYNKPNTHLKRK